MAGRTVSHWADAMLFGSSSSGRKSIEQYILPETFYLYRALVAGQTSNKFRPHRQCFYVAGQP